MKVLGSLSGLANLILFIVMVNFIAAIVVSDKLQKKCLRYLSTNNQNFDTIYNVFEINQNIDQVLGQDSDQDLDQNNSPDKESKQNTSLETIENRVSKHIKKYNTKFSNKEEKKYEKKYKEIVKDALKIKIPNELISVVKINKLYLKIPQESIPVFSNQYSCFPLYMPTDKMIIKKMTHRIKHLIVSMLQFKNAYFSIYDDNNHTIKIMKIG